MATITPNTVLKPFEKEEIEAQALVWKHMYGFADTIMLRTVVSLGIPDIVHNHHGPITLSQLATQLSIDSIRNDRLNLFMRYAVHMNLFKISTDEITNESRYELTHASKILVKSHNKSLASYVMLQTETEEFSIWGHVVDSLEGKISYLESNYGKSLYEALEKGPEIHIELFNDAMTSHSRFMLPAFISGLVKEKVLDGVGSIVDVGGGSGVTAKAIVDAFPHIKCSVMDLNHAIDSVIKDPKIDFVAGDMFTSIPNAEAILLKSTLHNHGDDDCHKILSNAKQAIPSVGGKVILVDIVVDIEDLPEFSSARLSMEMEMMFMGGKERTKQDLETMLRKAGFSHHKIIPILAIESIIVAYA